LLELLISLGHYTPYPDKYSGFFREIIVPPKTILVREGSFICINQITDPEGIF
jgi:hypothetical protein